MAVKFVSSDVSQFFIKVKIDDDDYTLSLTKHFNNWLLEIVEGQTDIIVSNLIDICNLIYSKNVIDACDGIKIKYSKNEEPIFIQNKEDVINAIIKAIKITVPKIK